MRIISTGLTSEYLSERAEVWLGLGYIMLEFKFTYHWD